MRHQLRAIDGPLTGAIYVLKKRTRIGRAGDSDIQIIHDGVSRQHAQVVELDGQAHEVVDLASNNGTFVDGRKVERHRLEPGVELRIVSSTFVYEEAGDDEPQPKVEVYAVKVTSGKTLRRTMSVMDVQLPPRPSDKKSPPPAPDDDAQPEQTTAQPERHVVVARRPDGTDYESDIIADVLEFRDLRLRSTRSESLDPLATRRLARLEKSLGQSSDEPTPYAARRRFCRFRVAFPARLRHGGQSGETTTQVLVVDLSAGGARVAATRHGLELGDLAWLVLDLEIGARARTFVLTSRVVRVYDDDQVGLICAGAPEWDSWRPEPGEAR
jgi:pSer/pThr/pTyr-binding forkhead associated (FHA) protein